MERERYINYERPQKPILDWTDKELFDEVDFIGTHRIEIGIREGERHEQLKKRMAEATFEQYIRYNERHGN